MAHTQPLLQSSLNASAASGTLYTSPLNFGSVWTTAEAEGPTVPIMATGTVRNMRIRAPSAPGAGISWTFTLRKNGSDTGITFTIADAATVGSATGTDVSITAEDTLSLKLVIAGGSAAVPAGTTFALEWEAAANNESIYSFGSNYVLFWSTWDTALFYDAAGFASTDPYSLVSAPGIIPTLKVILEAAPTSTHSRTFTIYKNGVAQDGSGGTPDTRVTITGTATSGVATFSLSVVRGDKLFVRNTVAGTPSFSRYQFGTVLRSTVEGDSTLAGTTHGDPIQDGEFNTLNASVHTWTTTETAREIDCPKLSLKDLVVVLTAAPSAGQAWTFTIRQNQTNPSGGPAVTIADTNTSGEDTSGIAAYAANDTAALGVVKTGTPTASVAHWAVTVSTGEPPEVEFAPGGEVEIGLTWVEITDRASTLRVHSKIALPDPSTYYGGFKDDRIIQWGQITRALSDRLGQYESATFTFVMADTDRLYRGLLDDPTTKFFKNRPATVRMIDDDSRRQLLTPRTMMKGVVREYVPLSPLQFQVTLRDVLATKFSSENTKDQIPKRLITLADFPDVSDDLVGLPVPIIYGELSDKAELTTIVPGEPGVPPTVGLSKPTNLSVNVVGGAGSASYTYGVTALDNRNNQWADFDKRTDHAGETDAAFITVTNAPDLDEMSASRYVEIRYDNPPGAVFNRIYGRSTNGILNLLDDPLADELYNDGERNGRREVDVEKTDSHPPEQNNTVVEGSPGTPESTIVTDTGKGLVPTIYVGLRTVDGEDRHEFLIAAHAVKAITSVYQAGIRLSDATLASEFLVPGTAEWTAALGSATYRDFNGRRYTVLYVDQGGRGGRAADGSEPITVNVEGIETVGDGSGTLITDGPSQYLHALQNWILGDYQSGAWLATPQFSDEALAQIDEASFATVTAVAQNRVAGGYVGAFIIGSAGERISIRDQVARLNVSFDMDSGFNRKTQFFVSMVDERIETLNAATSIGALLDVFKDTFQVRVLNDEHFNSIPYAYGQDYIGQFDGGWQVIDELSDAQSISDLEETKPSPRIDLFCIRDSTVALDIVARRLLRQKDPPLLISWEMGMSGLSVEVGDVVLLDHFGGLGSQGFSARPVRVIRHETDPDRMTVLLEAIDAERLFGGAFILGDETALASSWASAPLADRVYGYLGDETTGAFSDGVPMKRLR